MHRSREPRNLNAELTRIAKSEDIAPGSRCIRFANGSASAKTVAWTVDRDCMMIGYCGIVTDGVLSKDPALTWANFIAPTVTEVTDVFQIRMGTQLPQLHTPLSKGEKIYIAFSNVVGSAQLYLEDIIS